MIQSDPPSMVRTRYLFSGMASYPGCGRYRSASSRKDEHRWTMRQGRPLPHQRLVPPARCESNDRPVVKNRARTRSTTHPPQSPLPLRASTNRRAERCLRQLRSHPGRCGPVPRAPQEASDAETDQSGTRRQAAAAKGRTRANHQEMSKIDVAELYPIFMVRNSHKLRQPQRRLCGSLFRGSTCAPIDL